MPRAPRPYNRPVSDGPRAPLPSGLEATEISERELPLDERPPAAVEATLRGVGPPVNSTVPSAAPTTEAGELLAGDHVGRYIIERKVGAGGMGEVYAAHDPQLDRRVAIKVLRPSWRASDAAARLVREAQALAKLAHPNVVAVHDVGEADDRVFLAMQFVEGSTLGEHLARHALTPAQIVELYVAAGRGLAAAHAAGLVHRDMKPSNVLIDREGHVAVTDFGVARASDDFSHTPDPTAAPSWARQSNPSLSTGRGAFTTGRSALSAEMTEAGAVVGTPSFMAPEQHAGRRATAKSDQFGFCVSLWIGLFGKHPFVPDDRPAVTSPFEYMALITEGVLVAPRGNKTPTGHVVPRRVIAALTRGLARDPDARWPSMTELLAELAPPVSYKKPIVALAAVAAVGAGAAVWFGLTGRDRGGSTCKTVARERVTTAWTPSRASAVAAGFAKSGRSYAATTAKAATAALDRYAQRWTLLAVDACAGAGVAAAETSTQRFALARAQCLDRRLGALRSVATLFAEAQRPELVDNALVVVAGLPDLDECTDAAALTADGAPPPERAAAVAELESRLATAKAKIDAGLFREAAAELEALIPEADAAGWVPLRVRTRAALGDVKLGTFDPALPMLLEAARLATEHGLTRDAARAWAGAMSGAGLAKRPDAVEAYSEIARATAAATHDPALINRVRIFRGRALTRLRRFPDAEPECRAALAEARTRPGVEWRELSGARDCLVEALVPLGKWDEARAIAEEAMADRSSQLGPEHPAISDYLTIVARVKRGQGKVAEAKADFERARDLRLRTFGPRHIKAAESIEDLAGFERDIDKRKAMLDEALAIVSAPENLSPRKPFVEYSLNSGLAEIAARKGDLDGMQRHFERALALAEQLAGPASLDVGMLLIGYGQHLSKVDLDKSLGKLRRAAEILDALGDKRAEIARGALALILMYNERYVEALPVLEKALAAVDLQNIEPMNLALLRQNLATCLIETRGDRARARTLADQALEGYRGLGPDGVENVKYLERWIDKHW